MNDWYFFVLQAVVGNLRASRKKTGEYFFIDNKQERHRVGPEDWLKKIFLPVYFVSAVKKKMPVSASILRSWCLYRSL